MKIKICVGGLQMASWKPKFLVRKTNTHQVNDIWSSSWETQHGNCSQYFSNDIVILLIAQLLEMTWNKVSMYKKRTVPLGKSKFQLMEMELSSQEAAGCPKKFYWIQNLTILITIFFSKFIQINYNMFPTQPDDCAIVLHLLSNWQTPP